MQDLKEGKQREFDDEGDEEDEEGLDDDNDNQAEAKDVDIEKAAISAPQVNGTSGKSATDNASRDEDPRPSKRKAGLLDFGDEDEHDEEDISIAPKTRPSKRGKSRAEPTALAKPTVNANTLAVKANGAGTKRKADDDETKNAATSKRSKAAAALPTPPPSEASAVTRKTRATRSSET